MDAAASHHHPAPASLLGTLPALEAAFSHQPAEAKALAGRHGLGGDVGIHGRWCSSNRLMEVSLSDEVE
ncbi:MAG: hypothetical protein HC779_07020 [Phyllobacteriaceae bacterium]|nr:hypothetical protein [Phyllobacteriaceae bacterium]